MALCVHAHLIPGHTVARKLFTPFSNSCHAFNGLFELFSLGYIIGFEILTPSVSLKPLKPAYQQKHSAKFLSLPEKTFSWRLVLCSSRTSVRKGIVSLLSVLYDLRRMSWGYSARVTSSGARRGEAIPEQTPASLVTATNTLLTSITSSLSPHLLCVTSPLLFHFIHTLSSHYLSVFPLSFIFSLPNHPPLLIFFFFFY